MKDIAPILHSLGLADSEIKTYLAALENGASSVIDLAKLTGVSRQAVYEAINGLTKRGLMTSVVYGKKRMYSAEHPAHLIEYAKRRQTDMHEQVQELVRLLPELELQAGGEKPVVKVFEGKEGIRAIIEEMKKSRPAKTEEIADLDAMYKILTPEDLLPMRIEMKKRGTFVHGLYAGKPSDKVVSSERFALPPEYQGFQSNITIYDDKVSLVTFGGQMHSVIIESKELAKTLSILFSLAYKTAKREFPSE